ncbi:MAG: type II toxin-antitoxin system VapC family toxin [Thermomicrobiales bacterium]
MIILDTNVLSAIMQTVPDETVIAWLGQQPRQSVWTTVITIFEVRLGLSLLAQERRRTRLEEMFSWVISEELEQRVLPFDTTAAERAGELAAARQKSGFNIAERDTQIAGIVLARHAVIATRNVRDFVDLGSRVVNPWASL